LQQKLSEGLKPHQLTPTQYNVLRILRGAGAEGVTCSQAGERMVNHDPDMTRLLDRLEARKLVERKRSSQDRRIVITRITKTGLALVNSLDEPLKALLKQHVGHVGKERLEQLIDTLEILRNAPV
jgi:DNA-binding MarR family transcriptional regulator